MLDHLLESHALAINNYDIQRMLLKMPLLFLKKHFYITKRNFKRNNKCFKLTLNKVQAAYIARCIVASLYLVRSLVILNVLLIINTKNNIKDAKRIYDDTSKLSSNFLSLTLSQIQWNRGLTNGFGR